MKAKIIKTGEIVTIYKTSNGKWICVPDSGKVYSDSEIIVLGDGIDWEQRRFELVKSIASSVVSMEDYTEEQLATMIIRQADKIIKRLKEE